MPDQPGATDGTGQTDDNQQQPQISNQDVKNHPLFQKLTNQLGELQRADEERKQSEVESAKQEKIKKAEAEGNFKKAAELHQQQLADLENKHKTELTKRDLTLELTKLGATNKIFINGAIAGYDYETPIDEYIAALSSDESNQGIFGGDKKPPKPPGKTPVSGFGKNPTMAELKKIGDNPKSTPEQKQQARDYMRDFWNKHGKMPE